jgi:hypothetical protein
MLAHEKRFGFTGRENGAWAGKTVPVRIRQTFNSQACRNESIVG